MTLTLCAIFMMTSKRISRRGSEISFESLTSDNSGSEGSSKITAAITRGPAQGPRPASSTPAIGAMPALRRSSSIAFISATYFWGSCLTGL
ncbi:unannotated protein [freshwater metagenome]|uniref:Unannotated protein n=1 Tax=freshwater metagenome TaxID=449393 RepID=A0A6J6BI07_9ZZZZ